MVLGRPEWASTERGGGRLLLLLLGSALGEEDRVDVGEDTAVGDSNARKELGELLVVADGELDVAGDDARLLVVAGGVAGELEDLGTEVLEDGREVDGGASTDTVGVLALLEVPGDAADGELEPGLSVGNGGGERGFWRRVRTKETGARERSRSTSSSAMGGRTGGGERDQQRSGRTGILFPVVLAFDERVMAFLAADLPRPLPDML